MLRCIEEHLGVALVYRGHLGDTSVYMGALR